LCPKWSIAIAYRRFRTAQHLLDFHQVVYNKKAAPDFAWDDNGIPQTVVPLSRFSRVNVTDFHGDQRKWQVVYRSNARLDCCTILWFEVLSSFESVDIGRKCVIGQWAVSGGFKVCDS
jgi:hypothetical protein